MRRFYFSRMRDPRPYGSVIMAGVMEAETLQAGQAALDAAFKANRSMTTHESFDWVDLDDCPKRADGILVTTVMHK